MYVSSNLSKLVQPLARVAPCPRRLLAAAGMVGSSSVAQQHAPGSPACDAGPPPSTMPLFPLSPATNTRPDVVAQRQIPMSLHSLDATNMADAHCAPFILLHMLSAARPSCHVPT
ncbi:hypothetical protein J3E74DRAFT_289909 [Bipolaris maydis]|nr:hypothetical protein J3E74DRAFT_289909 [Bipolaris maydis]